MDILDQLTERKPEGKARKNIYNPKSNRMIAINGPVYRKLLLRGYMY